MVGRGHHVVLAALWVWVLALPSSGLASPGETHSGTLVAVRIGPRSAVVVVEEMVEEAETRLLTVRVTSRTRVILSRRLPEDQIKDLRYPFDDVPIAISDLRLGDFVVVELAGAAKEPVASSLTVTSRGKIENSGVGTRRHHR